MDRLRVSFIVILALSLIMSVPSAILAEEMNVIEETLCNAFGQPVTIILNNRNGEGIARLQRSYDGSFILRETLFDLSTGKELQTWTFDQFGRRQQPAMFLCLDDNGNIIRNGEEPVLIGNFPARQKSASRIRYSEYNSAIKAGEIKTIYPCENCAEYTGLKNCRYVW
jgi:hypothetical protein